MNGVLTDGNEFLFARVEGDTLYHVPVLDRREDLDLVLAYLSCFMRGDYLPKTDDTWPARNPPPPPPFPLISTLFEERDFPALSATKPGEFSFLCYCYCYCYCYCSSYNIQCSEAISCIASWSLQRCSVNYCY